MVVVAGNSVSVDPLEREMYARDAHGSATLLALMSLLWGIVALFFSPPQFRQVDIGHVVVGVSGLLYFIPTRKRPSTRAALIYCALVVVQALTLLPWTMVIWCQVGRPLEAFPVPQLAMISMALIIPRSFWLGVGVLALFALITVFDYFYAVHVGMRALIPLGEPYVSVCCAILGVGLLFMRDKRRELARRHIRVQAETEALRRVGPLFTAVRDELVRQLGALGQEIGRIDAARGSNSLDRAVGRLVSVSGTLGELVDEEVVGGAVAPSPTGEAERALLAHDTQLGALVLATLSLSIGLVFAPVNIWKFGRLSAAGSLVTFAASLFSFVYLISTLSRPSERRARWITLVLFCAMLPLVSYNQTRFLALGRPFSPFLGHKLLIVFSGLVAARRSLRLLLLFGTAAVAIALYFVLPFAQHKELIPHAEPWITLGFVVIGIAGMVMRDQRRLDSVQLLRAESAAAALHRRALMFLALRDQLNSPLQTLVVGVARLEAEQASLDLPKIRAATERLVALSRELAAVEIPSASQSASLDAQQQLRRHH